MKVYIDVNVLVDWAMEREPFAKNSTMVMQLAQQKVFDAYVSPLVMSNLFFILRKEKGKQATFDFIKFCKTFITFIDNSANALTQAIDNPYKDFEDDIHFYSALDKEMDILVTRNKKDFADTDKLQILTPDELLYELGY